jgi:outer membrane biosynthesis protein TonB
VGQLMLNWLDEVAGPGYSQAVLWALLALLVLVVLLVVIKLFRSMTFGTFVAGGRNRKNRLAVMDATAIDSHRRLVLVRRDDTEHLLLIGGASDIVVESDIRIGQQRRPAPPAAGEPVRDVQPAQPQPAQPPAPPAPAPAAPLRRMPEPPRAAPPPPPRPAERAPNPPPAARPEPPRPVAQPAPRQQANPSPQPKPAIPANASNDDLDDALLRELQFSLDDNATPAPRAPGPGPSLDDEMAKLLGELSSPRR